jgi:hypothetical protein
MMDMKILILGAGKLYNAEYFFQRAFRSLGYTVDFVDQYMGVRRGDFARILASRFKTARLFLEHLPINRYVLDRLKAEEYDLILVFKGELLTERSLYKLGEYNTWLFYPDTFRFRILLKDRLSLFKGVLVTTDRHSFYYSLGARRVHTIWWACDPDVHRPFNEKKIYDVSFVGSFYFNRYLLLRKLGRLNIKPHIFGGFWILRAGIHHPPVYGMDYARVVSRTKININIHNPIDIVAGAPNMRVFEIACMKGFLLTEEMYSLRRLFPKAATYRDPEDLIEKIEYYLENQDIREEISRAMYEEALRRHKYLDRAKEILGIAL